MSGKTDAERFMEDSETDETTRIVASDVRVGAGGRVTIPHDARERHEIEDGDYVDLVVVAESGAEDGDA